LRGRKKKKRITACLWGGATSRRSGFRAGRSGSAQKKAEELLQKCSGRNKNKKKARGNSWGVAKIASEAAAGRKNHSFIEEDQGEDQTERGKRGGKSQEAGVVAEQTFLKTYSSKENSQGSLGTGWAGSKERRRRDARVRKHAY